MEIKSDYHNTLPTADNFRLAVIDQVMGLITKNDIALGVPIESRIKSLSSIEGKISRKPSTPLSVLDFDDLVGLRLILIFKEDVKKTCDILTNTFEVIESEDTSDRLGENEFGYQSNHLILSMPEAWLHVPTLSDFSKMKVEVQVRTLSQHTWATASHKLQYKQEKNVPLPLKRSIHRLSALLETVDLELERLLYERRNYINEEISNAIEKDRLNVNIIEAICDNTLPEKNKLEGDEAYSEIMDELFNLGVETPSELSVLIKKNINTVLKQDRKYASEAQFTQPEIDRAAAGVFFTHCGLVRGCMDQEFGDSSKNLRRKKSREL